MKTCKNCGQTGEYNKFCSDCGALLVLTFEERLEQIEEKIRQFEKRKVEVSKPFKKRKERTRALDRTELTRRLNLMLDYAKKHKGLHTLSNLHKTVLKMSTSSEYITAFKKLIDSNAVDLGKLKIEKTPKGRCKIINSKYSKRKPREYDKQLSWASTRAGELKKQGIPMSEALKQAHDEYKAKYMIKPHAVVPIDADTQKIRMANKMDMTERVYTKPRIVESETVNTVLIGVVKNIILSGNKLTYGVDGRMLGIVAKSSWRDLLYKIVNNGVELNNYFGVSGRFIISTGSDGIEVLIFRK